MPDAAFASESSGDGVWRASTSQSIRPWVVVGCRRRIPQKIQNDHVLVTFNTAPSFAGINGSKGQFRRSS
jgi:hypothetical protein